MYLRYLKLKEVAIIRVVSIQRNNGVVIETNMKHDRIIKGKESREQMKVLVTIVNYGTKNRVCKCLISEYRSMTYSVDIVIVSNVAKDFGPY